MEFFFQGDKYESIRPNTLNFIKEKVRKGLELTGKRKYFLNRTLIEQALRPAINKWDLMKQKGLCVSKDTAIQTR